MGAVKQRGTYSWGVLNKKEKEWKEQAHVRPQRGAGKVDPRFFKTGGGEEGTGEVCSVKNKKRKLVEGRGSMGRINQGKGGWVTSDGER